MTTITSARCECPAGCPVTAEVTDLHLVKHSPRHADNGRGRRRLQPATQTYLLCHDCAWAARFGEMAVHTHTAAAQEVLPCTA